MNIKCPYCGETQDMHHSNVDVFERPGGEDGDGVCFSLDVRNKDGCFVNQKSVAESDMPGRRNAIRIAFECWICGRHSILQIKQHKGTTAIDWVTPDAELELEG
jgi:hypothetical protein